MQNIISAVIICVGLICGGSFVGGRYAMVAVNGGVVARLDRATGDVESCQLKYGQKCIWLNLDAPASSGEKREADYPVVIPIPTASADPQQP